MAMITRCSTLHLGVSCSLFSYQCYGNLHVNRFGAICVANSIIVTNSWVVYLVLSYFL